MEEETYRTLQNLLSSSAPEDLRRGLALVGAETPAAGREARTRMFELVLPLFYIDPLDHPEHLAAIEQAIGIVADMGEAIIPALIQNIEGGDVKAQLVIAQTLGRMGGQAIEPLIAQYQSGCGDPSCRAFLLYALGKVKSPEIVKAGPLAVEAAASFDLELRDTATRALGKFVESVPPGRLPAEMRVAILAQLQARLADDSPGIRSKAVRSLGKLAKYGHLTPQERGELKVKLQRILGEDEHYEWDRAYVVRKEAKEALGYV